jgi:hypothetical protein
MVNNEDGGNRRHFCFGCKSIRLGPTAAPSAGGAAVGANALYIAPPIDRRAGGAR